MIEVEQINLFNRSFPSFFHNNDTSSRKEKNSILAFNWKPDRTMKSFTRGSLFLSLFFYSCSSPQAEANRRIEKIAAAVKASPDFANSDLQNFGELDTLFITANELPRYRRLLDDITTYDSLVKDAKKLRDGKPAADQRISEETRADIDVFIETVEYEKENRKNALTYLIDNATDTIYRIECTEQMKSEGKAILTTHAIVYVNSDMKVIDYRH